MSEDSGGSWSRRAVAPGFAQRFRATAPCSLPGLNKSDGCKCGSLWLCGCSVFLEVLHAEQHEDAFNQAASELEGSWQ